jgi:2-polyprenyl-6-methoxyphenol hydroxylase-like FAD-dependent oxidoreductase
VLGELDMELADSPYPFDLGISEEVTERLLTACLDSLGGAVMRSTRLAGFVQRSDGAVVTLERDGETLELETEWLVGCDGLHSVVREGSGIEFPGRATDAPWAVFDAAIAEWDRELDVVMAYLDLPPVVLTPLPAERWRVYMRPTSPDGNLITEASGVLHRYAPQAEFADVENPARFHCHSRVAQRYRSGRALLAGDAAHVCSPAEGHGMNTGIQDAFNLGWKLALVCRGVAGEGLLETYEIERRPVAERIVSSGADVEAGQALTEAAARAERDASIRMSFADAETAHHEAVAAAELDRSYAASPIVSGDGSGGAAAGSLLPSTVRADHPATGPGLLHRLAHRPGHTLMVLGGAGGDPSAIAGLVEELGAETAGSATVDAVFGFSTRADGDAIGRIGEDGVGRLGISDVTMLAVRPDRYVGLRHDGPDTQPLARYLKSLTR